jgi:hypothetical protein
MAKKKKKPNQPKHTAVFKKPPLLRSRAIFILPLGACLVIGAVLFLSYFSLSRASLTPVYIGNTSLDSTASEPILEKHIAALAASYRLTLRYPDASQKSFALDETGIAIDSQQSAKTIQNYLHNNLWQRLAWWQPIRLKLVTATNKTKLAEFIASKATVITKVPQDAILSAPNGLSTITPEIAGSGFRIKQPEIALTESTASLNFRPLLLKKTTLEPAIIAKDLKSSENKLETILNRKVNFSLAGHIITPTRATIADWVELSPVKTAKTVDVTINSGKILAYIDKIASPYVASPRNKLIMNMPSGPFILDYGEDGTDITNKDKVAAQAAGGLLKGEQTNIDLSIEHAAAKTVELQPYDKFIVVDISDKRLYAYEKTNLVRTVLISAGAPGTPTVLGQYKIYSKRVSQDMRGGNVDGSRYFQAAVPYVNYFYGSYAIHGNYWRPDSWFGNINSSHGCIGIHDPDDAWVYSWAPVGTPVIVHS